MKKLTYKIKVADAAGSVSAILYKPRQPICIMTLAHGAGANMHHPFLENLARGLADVGIATLRFNFPFTENKKGRPDRPPAAHATIEAAMLRAAKLLPSLPLFAAGKSFGGRMTSQFIAEHHPGDISGVIFYGFPLHAPGKPSVERADHLKQIKIPMLFLQGAKDALAEKSLIKSLCSKLKLAKLINIEGADHSFKAGKTDTMTVLVKATSKWTEQVLRC